MTRIVLVGGGNRLGKSVMAREVTEAARDLGYEIVEVGPGITGRVADTVILDELKHLQGIPQIERKVPQEPHYAHTMTNRKARRAARSKRK